MRAFLALGSNLNRRLENLERAARELGVVQRASPIFETPALVPPGAPAEWHVPYLNAVVEVEWQGSARELFIFIKKIEERMGREQGPRWSPRSIDLDLLWFDGQRYEDADLKIPHPEMTKRSFVLDPLKHLDPLLLVDGKNVLSWSREKKQVSPVWMGVMNLTPDSFSDGGGLSYREILEARIQEWHQAGVPIFDLGAESTRPGATPISAETEWARLETALELLQPLRRQLFRPLISVDTRHASVARLALEQGADIINDVSGLADPEMLRVLQESECQYVLMHSLSVPADGKRVLAADVNPVEAVKAWAFEHLDKIEQAGVDRRRLIFDPGIGFGKTPYQSVELLKGIDSFFDLGVRLLIGHSRKSFLNLWSRKEAKDRDLETIGVSLQLARRGVDFLRVHDPIGHQRTFRAYQELEEVSRSSSANISTGEA